MAMEFKLAMLTSYSVVSVSRFGISEKSSHSALTTRGLLSWDSLGESTLHAVHKSTTYHTEYIIKYNIYYHCTFKMEQL